MPATPKMAKWNPSLPYAVAFLLISAVAILCMTSTRISALYGIAILAIGYGGFWIFMDDFEDQQTAFSTAKLVSHQRTHPSKPRPIDQNIQEMEQTLVESIDSHVKHLPGVASLQNHHHHHHSHKPVSALNPRR